MGGTPLLPLPKMPSACNGRHRADRDHTHIVHTAAILHRVTRTSHSVTDTEHIAAELARTLSGGEVIALYGDLGAGKTQFTRGLVIGLGGDGRAVSSPTFVLLNIYETPALKIFHLDAYRVYGPEDFDAIGFTELLEQGGVVVVEWPSRVEALLPEGKRINVHLETISPNGRRVRVERAAV
jgi:tRNA threonylcarbamoyladenosine biosynthesis protein TsaE